MRFQGIRFRRGPGVDVSDLTPACLTGPPRWADGEPDCLVLDFDRDLTPAEAAAIRRRLVTVDAEEEQRVAAMAAGRDALRALRAGNGEAAIRDAVVALLDQALAAYDE